MDDNSFAARMAALLPAQTIIDAARKAAEDEAWAAWPDLPHDTRALFAWKSGERAVQKIYEEAWEAARK